MKRKKIYVGDIVTTLDGTDYIIIDDGSGKLKAISKTNFSSQIGITIENKIVATEDNIIDFAAASAGYTFDERDMIQLAPDSDGNVLVYIFLGGTKTDVARYVKVDYSKIDWANILSKPITFNATAPTVTDDSDSDFVVGDLWMARDTQILYKLTDASVGAAVWEVVGGSVAKTFTNIDLGTKTGGTQNITPTDSTTKYRLIVDSIVTITSTNTGLSVGDDVILNVTGFGGGALGQFGAGFEDVSVYTNIINPLGAGKFICSFRYDGTILRLVNFSVYS